MYITQRKEIILNLIEKKGSISVDELATKFKVSAATIRSDLNELDSRKLVTRTHGGAIRRNKKIENYSEEQLYDTRKSKNLPEKRVIAYKALAFIHEGDCIILDASSTCYELAKLLLQEEIKLTVLTSGLRTANLLKESRYFNVIIIGGLVKHGSNAVESTLGLDLIHKFNIDTFFASSYAVSITDGLSDFSLYESELKKELIHYAEKTLMLIDHSKFEKKSIIKFAEIEDVNLIITDDDLTPSILKEYSSVTTIK
ncbi:DeoR/GlpR family DNA-binding transcription regulator [Enterococcus xiangfangensis]|uniref:DeoR/GlpR family DNA-binding transcription regulator n=1 Tax=Enterococcus xiangfangensis TaxID=1296537 RepID=A0ABU3FB74_9ENTE|nr:DeoR/GlpR family DNA-binding transcription regulator [Enterococcus xiangfangensis]MDT2759915.1 DeoR/GlpR family DNA-binding transcription regulator [Enterococcus xiangfangensis]